MQAIIGSYKKNAGLVPGSISGLKLISAANAHFVGDSIDGAIARDASRNEACVLLVAPDDGLHDHEGHCIRALPRHSLPSHGDVGQWAHLVVAVEQLGSAEVGLRGANHWWPGLDSAKGFLSE